MRNTLFFLPMAAGLAIACTSSASAVPINGAAVKAVATSAAFRFYARSQRIHEIDDV